MLISHDEMCWVLYWYVYSSLSSLVVKSYFKYDNFFFIKDKTMYLFAGVYGFPGCPGEQFELCDIMRELISIGAYLPWVPVLKSKPLFLTRFLK